MLPLKIYNLKYCLGKLLGDANNLIRLPSSAQELEDGDILWLEK